MNTNELKRLLSSYRLAADERAALRARIVAAMQSSPAVRDQEENCLPLQGTHTWAFLIKTSFATPPSYRYTMTIVLLLALLAGGGTSLAAEQALPGDILYPVKVDLVEPIRATLAVSPEAKAKWEARIAERRLEEGEALLAHANLSQETKAAIEQRFLVASANAKANIAAVRERDAAAAAFIESDFETSLKTHRFIIERLDDDEDESRRESSSLRAIIDLQFSRVSSTEPSATSAAAKRAEQRSAVAERALDDASRFIAKNAAAMDATTNSTIALYLEAAKQAFASGTAALSAHNYDAAFAFFAAAHEDAQNAKAAAAAARELWKKFEKRTDDLIKRMREFDEEKQEKKEERGADDNRRRERTTSSTLSSSSSSRFDNDRSGEYEREDSEEDEEDDDRSHDRGRAPTSTTTSTTPSDGTPPNRTVTFYSKTQVALHASTASCWTIVQGSVYDVTAWIRQHPGGASAIISLCGTDGSAAFNGQHGGQSRPLQELNGFMIGKLSL